MNKGIVITGIGLVSGRGTGPLRNLALCDDPPPPPGPERGLSAEAFGAVALLGVRDADLQRWLPSAKTYLDPASAYTLAAVHMALGEAGGRRSEAPDPEIGIVLGTAFGCLNSWQAYWTRVVQKGNKGAHSLLFSHAYLNTPTSLAAIEYGLRGYHATLAAGRLSGLQALVQASLALERGHARRMLAVAVEALAEPWLRALRRHWRSDTTPGCLPAEGGAAFMLEPRTPEHLSLEWGQIAGWAFTNGREAVERAVLQTLTRAGWRLSDLHGTVTHASGVPAWDDPALAALQRLLPPEVQCAHPALNWGEAFGAADGLHLAYLLSEAGAGQQWLLVSWDESVGAGALAVRTEMVSGPLAKEASGTRPLNLCDQTAPRP